MNPLVIGALVVAGTTTAVVVAAEPDPDRAVVTKIVDGDTIDVRIDDRVERIRLLNIDTPETVHPDEDVQCLGPEAAAHLADLVPVGSAVELEYDEERVDRYGRTLAGVFAEDGELVNAEMARAGLAVPVVVGDNDRFAADVRAASAEAAAAGRGLYSPQIDCTVPAQVRQLAAELESMPTAGDQLTDATVAQLTRAAASAVAVKIAANRLVDRLDGTPKGLIWSVIDESRRTSLRRQLVDVGKAANREAVALGKAATVRAVRPPTLPEPTQAVGKPEPKPKAAPKAKAVPPPKPKPTSKPAPKPEPKSQSSGANPYPGYTGPRCYAPGGKTWKPC